ncbi:MAG: protein kinase domain-containing protein, partial [Gemmataceae bacterium]
MPTRDRESDMAPDGVGDFAGMDWLRLSSGDAAGPRPPAAPQWHAPERVGPYEIREEVGRGGMGVVYRAFDPRLNRTVALKMLLAGGHAGGDERRRFLNEASALARLTHPNIVPVFEVGEHAGLPFFSMEFVTGEPLSARMARGPAPSPRDAAKLAEDIARAVQHAHAQGVIHRDLKPANILLDAGGAPHVSDFGIARLVEQDDRMTRPGQVLGTPAYLAPELLGGPRGTVGPGSDVYSLGVLLYELLTGRPPFQGDSVPDVLFQLSFHAPITPRRWRPGISRDLETVVLKCLERDPRARYASAAELADDLTRFREGRPVRARPVGPLRRGWRWAKRNPAVASLAAAAAVLLASAVVSLAAGLHWARAGREQAERRQRQTRRALDLMTSAVFDDLLVRQHHLHAGQREFLEKARAEYAELAADAGDGPAAAAASARLGTICRRLGQPAEAEASYRQALRLYEAFAPDDVRGQAGAAGNLGVLLAELGRPDEAGPLYRRSIDLLEPLDDDRAAQTRALRLADLGRLRPGRPKEALARLDEARRVQERLAARPEPGDVPLELAATRNAMGGLAMVAGDRSAEGHFRAALKLWADAAAPDAREAVAGCRSNLGSLLMEEGRAADGLKELKLAADGAERLAAEFPSLPRYRARLA